MSERLPKSVLAAVILRSFLLQGSWNFERMQNLGVLYALAPALRLMFPERELLAASQRHLLYFNTHPYLAAPVLGATLALEERTAQGAAEGVGVAEFKNMIMAPYAAIGDALFWGGLRPLAAGIAMFFAVKGSLWAPVVLLLLFNGPHLWLRCLGLIRGYRQGLGVIDTIQRRRLPDLAMRCKEATIVVLGVLSGLLVYSGCREQGIAEIWGVILLGPIFLVTFLVRKGWSPLLLVFLVTGLVLVLSRLIMV